MQESWGHERCLPWRTQERPSHPRNCYTDRMMDQPVPSPHRRSVLAVWQWPRWAWGIVAALFVIYHLSIVPFVYVMEQSGVSQVEIHSILEVVYAPLLLVCDYVPMAYDVLYKWQFDLLEELFGEA
jgi:hypothetical protein